MIRLPAAERPATGPARSETRDVASMLVLEVATAAVALVSALLLALAR